MSLDPLSPQRVRHTLKFRRLSVLRSERITPHLIRVTLTGDDLQGFNSPGFDDHAKLMFPDPLTGELRMPQVSEDGTPVWGEGPRPQARDYTPRAYDARANELVFEFALHEAGPATAWAERARPGDILGVGGPRGSFMLPMTFDGHVLIGDDTALPAICRRLEELPLQARVLVLIEVDSAEDEIALPVRPNTRVEWVHRSATPVGGAAQEPALLQALQRATMPEGDIFVWIACESILAKQLRAHLVNGLGLSPKRIRASGYWRRGASATHDSIE